ncbi:replicative DNA helicase [Aquihabitans sp. G128]|uniref:replicative DNA helicase n=1 Tax=Aquihabitans sp. G128 TaxID=2849779 RepID=UPI001C225A0E|nr:replicative DNA helicase [Aquihabitans sp. G128]QXC59345.1 replicative DNA helicase [Aquihabitans sp. G128]
MTATDEEPPITAEEEAAALADQAQQAEPPRTAPRRLRSVPDRITLYDTDTEAALLGAALQSNAARDLLATVAPEAFGDPAHGHIADAIQHLHAEGQAVDYLTVADHLRRRNLLELIAGPPDPNEPVPAERAAKNRLMSLLVQAPSTSAAGRYATIVRDLAQLRRLGALGAEITAMVAAPGTSPTDAASAAQTLLDEVHDAAAAGTSQLNVLGDVVDQYLEELALRQDQPLAGISTGFLDLDKAIGGFQNGRLYVIAGRPGMGKSDVAIHLGRSAAEHAAVLVTSIEMPKNELLDRWIAHGSGLSSTSITHGSLGDHGWALVTDALTDLQDLPIWIDDNPATSMATIRADVRRSGARMVIVDYLQIIETASAESRQIEVTRLARALKRLARELDIPVVALAQLNRGVEGRLDKRPQLADLRESGAIEQEADVVIGLYRDEVYDTNTKDAGVLELGLLKNRTGPNGIVVRVGYLPRTKQFANLSGANP